MPFVTWFECLWEELLCGNSIYKCTRKHAVQSSLSCITQYHILCVCVWHADVAHLFDADAVCLHKQCCDVKPILNYL